jgi:hypothetical protein
MSVHLPANPESVFTYGAPQRRFGGALKQQRLLATAPRDVTEDDLAGIVHRSLHLW